MLALGGAQGRLGRKIGQELSKRGMPFLSWGRQEYEDIGILSREIDSGLALIIDVSLPEGTAQLVENLIKLKKPQLPKLIIGTTGHNDALKNDFLKLSKLTPICVVSNFSLGVMLFEEMLNARTSSGDTVSNLARRLGFDLALWESHHALKKDAPSGTAKTLAIAAQIEEAHISSTRVGRVVGEHVLHMSAEGEELRVSHIAHSRSLFARGATDLATAMMNSQVTQGNFKAQDFIFAGQYSE